MLSAAGTIVDAVKSGAIRHFFLVGGCDGARSGRNYYTEFVKQTPPDTIVLTLACGKYRFNDLDLGSIGDFPRIMDMGQCNDAYSAIKVAAALAEAFDCGLNELPLTLVLSWYEQKAVCILLSLLHLGLKNIYLGPTLPAFISPNVLQYLVDNYQITPVSTPEEDLKKFCTIDIYSTFFNDAIISIFLSRRYMTAFMIRENSIDQSAQITKLMGCISLANIIRSTSTVSITNR